MTRGAVAVVVGGGMVGAACADALARAGARVTVVEERCVGAGATAAGMGHLVVMDDSPAQLALTSRSLELWAELASELPVRAEYRRCGTAWVASDDADAAAVTAKQAAYQAVGRRATAVDGPELGRTEPALRPGLAGGLLVPDDAVVYAPVAAQFLLERAGVTVVRDAVVAVDPGKVRLASGGTLPADFTVLAAGMGALALLPDLPLRARKGHLLITERGAPQVRHQLVELGYLRSAHGSEEDSVAFNVQPRPTGQLLIGSSRQFGQTGPDVEWPLLQRMLRRAAAFLPALTKASALRVWTGQRCATPDHLPLIGPLPDRPDLLLAVGHEGLGITTALGTAELLLHHLTGRVTPLAAHDFTTARLTGPREHAHA
ncbi:NAD(P)/FAD-dependent oxidoreductase [Deinococcus ficus]|uniref:D-amino-acid oxidase n=1 Tax=Deinococcus ficus TaxID=317577 RepID=A0A221T1J7_9DEIO|nr:FAD-binding oxidoreductase [Deinococcus ficus]ASN82775.1 D-amino-acid oxidase [Deinococcus ficus]